MLTHGEVPSNMKHGLVITLLKHGKKNKSDPNNYRGIVLLPVIYKLFEKVTLKRIISAMEKNTESFPDPLQGAYQKQLSSLNTSLILTETIKYNTERGSKVFSCFLDTVKAFDYVWHDGLMVRLYEAGIKGKMWNVIRNAYSNVKNYVLHNGCISKPIDVLQSTRQGSFWGAHFFLFYVNPLIKLYREANLGAKIGNIFCGAVFHADDIALMAVQKETLQRMMDICYKFNCQWRLNLHPKKTKIMVFGETRHHALTNSATRIWKLGDKNIEEVKNHVHCV